MKDRSEMMHISSS